MYFRDFFQSFSSFEYVITVILYYTGVLWLVTTMTILICIFFGGLIGWLVWAKDIQEDYTGGLSNRAMCLWNSVHAIGAALITYMIFLITGQLNGFLGITFIMGQGIFSLLPLAIVGKKDTNPQKCITIHRKKLCIGSNAK